MENIYSDGTYKEITRTWHTEDSAWKANQIMDAIKRKELYPAVVCEVGCGAGEILWELSRMLPEDVQLVGFEPSSLARAMQRLDPIGRIQFKNGDFLTTPTEHFDILLLIDVFEHIPDYFGFLQAIRSRADVVIFHIPLELTAFNLFRGGILAASRNTLGHLHFFNRDIESCGYTIVSESYTNWVEELPHRASLQPFLRHSLRLLKLLCGDHTAVRLLGGHSLLVVAKS